MLTPQRIQDLADPIEEVYIHIVDELLVNIGRHITSPNWTHTASWEIQKLSELGQLTQENAAIINRWIKTMPQAVRDTMEATRAAALDQIEREMEKAAQAGYLTPPETDSTVTVLRDLSDQAIDKYNLTNTQMLQSSVAQYAKAVNLTAQEYARLTARAVATQGVLNEAAASVASGTETRLTAVRRALTRISDEGLTGFIDKAGRSWSPEAYVNMVTRTTVHNVAVQSVQARMQDYNAQVFQVSAHAGARPLCYPYQGKLYSWDNTAGEIEAGDGKVWRYAPLRETSYGQPAGLFGINCGHSPIPIIPGVSIPHAQDFVQPKEENDKAYAESQEQRELERKIREAKRVVEMAGDAATKEDKAKVRELQKQMREFIDRTGRTRRYDREQIGGTPKQAKNQGPTAGPSATPPPLGVVNYGNAIQKINNPYKGAAEGILDSAPGMIQGAWNKASGQMDEPIFQVDPKIGQAYFDRDDGRVHFIDEAKAYDKNNYEEEFTCFFHEYGHNVDWILGGSGKNDYLSTTYNGGEFGKTLFRECEDRIKEWYYASKGFTDDLDAIAYAQSGTGGMGVGSYVRQLMRATMPLSEYRAIRDDLVNAGNDVTLLRPYFKKHLAGSSAVKGEVQSLLHQPQVGQDFCDDMKRTFNPYERADISDMFNQYTLEHYGIGYPFGYGHKNNYWGAVGDHDALAKEAFAEMFSATATQSQSLSSIKSFFPDSYAVFEKMLGGQAP